MPAVSKRSWNYKGETKTAYIIRYVDVNGVKRQSTFRKKKEAEKFAFEIEKDISNGVVIGQSAKASIKDICELFIRHQEDRWRQGAIGQGRYMIIKRSIDQTILPRLGKLQIAALTPLIIEEWFRENVRSGKLSLQTAKHRLDDLKLICRFAVKHKYIRDNPVAEAVKEIGSVKRVKIRTFMMDEIAALIRATASRDHLTERNHVIRQCFIYLALFCGLRLGEICALKRKHINFDRGIIEVRHSLTLWGEIKGPKTEAGIRDVPMPSQLAQIMRLMLDRYFVANTEDLVFTGRTGGWIKQPNFRNHMWYPLLKAAGLPPTKQGHMHFHALRHFAASFMIANRMTMPEVASLCGHENFDLTLRIYAHPIVGGSNHGEAFERMATRLLPPPIIEDAVIVAAV